MIRKNIFRLFAIGFLLMTIASESNGQTMKELFTKVSKNYLAVDPFSADVDVYIFKDKNDVKGSLLGKGLLRKSGKNYYSKFSDDELICNEHCTVILDHYSKTASYFYEPKTRPERNSYELPDIDTLLKLNDSIIYQGVVEGCKLYSFYTHRGAIKQTQVSIDTTSFFVKKIVYYYAEANERESYDAYKISIHYKNLSLKKISNDVFSEKQYVVMRKGQPRLTEAYKGYKLTVVQNEKDEKKSF